jgi:hypothetical protein
MTSLLSVLRDCDKPITIKEGVQNVSENGAAICMLSTVTRFKMHSRIEVWLEGATK